MAGINRKDLDKINKRISRRESEITTHIDGVVDLMAKLKGLTGAFVVKQITEDEDDSGFVNLIVEAQNRLQALVNSSQDLKKKVDGYEPTMEPTRDLPRDPTRDLPRDPTTGLLKDNPYKSRVCFFDGR